MGMASNGYRMHISGPEGRETYMLTYRGQLVGGGDLRKTLAKSHANTRAQKRLADFEAKNHTLSQAEARLRLFELDSKLIESDATRRRP